MASAGRGETEVYSLPSCDGDDHPLQTAIGVVTEQPDGAQDLVTYFGEDLCPGDQRQKFYSVQVVRNEDSGVVIEILCDKYTSMALFYLYRKGTMKVKHFCKDMQVEKIAVEKEVAMMISLRTTLVSARTGPSLPIMSKMLANLELTIFLVSFLGTKRSILCSSREKNLVPSVSFPLFLNPKCRGGTFTM